MGKLRMGGVAAWLLCAIAVVPGDLKAAPASFTGSFASDSDQREFFFTLNAPVPVTLRTLSYAGGVNAAAVTIPAGGFDPTLSLYDSNGVLVAVNQDAGCPAAASDPVTSSCWDSLISVTLPAGAYRVVLTQSTNLPGGATLADSFIYNPANLFRNSNLVNNTPAPPFGGQLNFTQPPGGAAGGFWDFFPSQRTSFFALDITGAASAVAPSVLTSATLPFGIAGTAYTPVSLAVQSGAGVSYTWTPPASGLPSGLSLNSSGVLSGTPAASGVYTFTVVASDGVQSVQQTETLTVYNPLSITTSTLPGGVSGSAYGPVQLSTAGGSGVFTWTAVGLAAGLTLSPSGVLSGTAPSAIASFTVTVSDTVTSQMDSRLLTLAVTAPPPPTLLISGGGTLSEVAAGSAVSASFGATGGSPPYTFTSSNLPAGLSVNAASGLVSGTAATPGNFTFSVNVADAGGQSAVASASLAVLGFTSGALPPAVKGAPYSFNFTAAGGAGPYTFSSVGLPAGLSLSASGVLTGNPTDPGSHPFTARVSDGSVTASVSVSLFVSDPGGKLTVSGGALPDGRVKTAYSGAVSATGGTAPYNWSIVGGTLPDGLALATDGGITGMPLAPGSSAFTAQAIDANGAIASGAFTILIAPAPLVMTTGNSLPNGIVGSDYPLQIFSVTGGVEPYLFSISAGTLPAGLSLMNAQISGIPTAIGTSSFTLTITDAAGKQVSTPLSITINPAQADLILSQTFLSFSTMTGASTLPTADNVTVRSSVVQQLLNYSYALSPSVPWLSVSGGTTTPGSLSISLTNAALALPASANAYQATVAITCTAPSPCAGRVQNVSVSLVVSAPPAQLSLGNSLLSFTAPAGRPQLLSSPLAIQNIGGGALAISSITAADSWVTVSGAPSTVASGSPVSVNVTVNPTGLPIGYSRSSITVTSSAGSRTVPVTLFRTPASALRASPESVSFSLPAGGTLSPATGSFQVSTNGSANWTASVLPGAPWLRLTTVSGTSTESNAAAAGFAIDTAAVAQLAPGVAYGRIRIASPDATNSPQDFHVILRLNPRASLPFPDPSPAGLVFQSGQPVTKTVTVFAASTGSLSYQASASTTDGASWLAVSPTTGSTSAGSPAASSVTVNTAGLAPGVYSGLVSYAFSAAAVRSVNVTLLVTSSGPGTLVEARAEAACASSQLIATHTGLVSNFTQFSTLPAPLQVTVIDTCGRPVTNAQVNVTFSNGDPPVLLMPVDNASGIYSGAWVPAGVSPQATVSANVTASGFTGTTARINGEVAAGSSPAVTPNAVLGVFDPLIGGAIAPGGILQIYGSNLAAAPATSSTVPLTTSLADTSVSIGGIPAPLYYVSPGQINAEAPFELREGNRYQVIVNNAGALSAPGTLTVAAAAPGIAEFSNGQIIAQHLDGTLVSVDSPAKPNTYVIFYLAGLGATDVPVATGAGSPVTPLAHPADPPVLTLDGARQTYQFVGLTPGIVGLYQINFLVPAGTRDGDLKLVISQSRSASNEVILPVRR